MVQEVLRVKLLLLHIKSDQLTRCLWTAPVEVFQSHPTWERFQCRYDGEIMVLFWLENATRALGTGHQERGLVCLDCCYRQKQ